MPGKSIVEDGRQSAVSSSKAKRARKIKLSDHLRRTSRVKRGLICVDFGTATSKVGFDDGRDRVEPLEVGRRAGEGDPFWVNSAIAIDRSHRMVFGTKAVEAARKTKGTAVTSFKNRLWAGSAKLNEVALSDGKLTFTFRDCIQAYLAFLTHCAARDLEGKKRSPYTPRRYSMPFAYDPEHKEIRATLGDLLGRAVVLADTLGEDLVTGVDVEVMREALDLLERSPPGPEWLLAEPGCVGEPVAAGNFAMEEEALQLTVYMIVDIGAGTTDFCILCLKNTPDGELVPLQIRNGALSIETAGQAVDEALTDYLVQDQAGEENRPAVAAQARTIKERIFALTAADDERVDVDLPGDVIISVERQRFLKSKQWKAFVQKIKRAQATCFDKADRTFLQRFGTGAIRIVITGGGSTMPLRDALGKGRSPGKVKVLREFVADMPQHVRNRFPANIADLPRLAVALGGSRPFLPQDYDRSEASTGSGPAGRLVYKPVDKTRTGLDDIEPNGPGK